MFLEEKKTEGRMIKHIFTHILCVAFYFKPIKKDYFRNQWENIFKYFCKDTKQFLKNRYSFDPMFTN